MNAPQVTAETLLTARQCAARLNISERHLWTLTRSGDIPCVRLGRSLRYDPADLAAFLTKAKTTACVAAAGGDNGRQIL